MDFLYYRSGKLYALDYPVEALAEQYGTPLYIYNEDYIKNRWIKYDQALNNRKHLICYAIKANSNLAILHSLAKLGAGFDIVSQGELERVLHAGADPKKIVFSGVAKSVTEIERALNVGIKCFNVESEAELYRIQAIAKQLNKIAPISLRINPDVDAKTHPYISTGLRENKFGISYQLAYDVYRAAAELSHISIEGIDCHIGSQLTELSPFLDSADRIIALFEQLKLDGIHIKHIDFGGGVGVCYKNEQPLEIVDLVNAISEKLVNYPEVEILFEPGRSIVANAGLLVTKVEYTKHQDDNHFAIVDAGMNDLIRPALYNAWMNIIPVNKHESNETPYSYNIVGPICESSDVLGKNRQLAIKQDDLLAICGAGAYGFSMASNYNSHPRPAEVMINSLEHRLIRKRETFQSLWDGETI
ncbi:diaminopimelate decarboxylase [Frischella perrara]|uniref:diaminopimelate decarboxylase n=1 Tax=Frischella perrara TaxID=1267021 RepID=UPI0023F112FF|nr:diaminopimelate decarboxylase [Frischella perrara]